MSTSVLLNGALALQSLTVNSVAITPPLGGTGAVMAPAFGPTTYINPNNIAQTIPGTFTAGNLYQFVWTLGNIPLTFWALDSYISLRIVDSFGTTVAGCYVGPQDWSTTLPGQATFARTYTLSFIAPTTGVYGTLTSTLPTNPIATRVVAGATCIKVNGT
jgi:hypothetical protein